MESEKIIQWSRRALQGLLDLLYPPRCAACGLGGVVLCSVCRQGIKPLPTPYCRHCGNVLKVEGVCRSCQYAPLRLSGLRAYSGYQQPLRTCIHRFKYGGNARLSQPLGQFLAQAHRVYGLRSDVIVPVPLHSERQRQRGYNQAHLLAESCSRELQIPLQTLLTRIRNTPAQTRLAADERRQNVAGAFRCSAGDGPEAITGRRILLIDDVCTTGATLEACAAPLFAAGARTVWGLVLARPLAHGSV